MYNAVLSIESQSAMRSSTMWHCQGWPA